MTPYFRFLATGNSQVSIAFNYRVSPQSVAVILRQTMTAICQKLGPIYLPKPTAETWIKSEEGFRTVWNFPNAVAAIDGKHCRIRAPKYGGSNYFNYKHFHSVVLLALVDPHYKFLAVDIGASGSQSDGGVFSRSVLGTKISEGKLGLPGPKAVGTKMLPHVILGDDAFSLRSCLMKPYPGKFLPVQQRIFNYRMCRGRMVVENAFGILAARWRIFHTPITANMDLVRLIIRTTVILHNYLMSKNDMNIFTVDEDNDSRTGNWRSIVQSDAGLEAIPHQGSNNYANDAKQIRDSFCHYFNNEGAVSWQNSKI